MDDLTHLNAQGDIRMVDVTDKQATLRVASAEGKIFLQHRTLKKIKNDALPKGNVFTTAKIAGITCPMWTWSLKYQITMSGLSQWSRQRKPLV